MQQLRKLPLAPLAIFIGLCLIVFMATERTAKKDASFLIDCESYFNDPMMDISFEEITKDTIESWATSVYGNLENWNDNQWDDGSSTIGWTTPTGLYHANFIENGTKLLYISKYIGKDDKLSGQRVTQCFGEPTYYQAYFQPGIDTRSRIMELVYPNLGLIIQSYHFSEMVGDSRLSERAIFQSLIHFPTTDNTIESIAPYISRRRWFSEEWDALGWAEVALHEWEGWDNIQVVTDEIIAQGSPRAPATATALATTFFTSPPFPTQSEILSPVCQAVISPILYNLQYGTATPEETRLLLRGLYQHFYGVSDHRIESSSRSDDIRTGQVLTWNVHTDESSEHDYFYTANFNNDILQNAESTVYGTELSEYIACFGDPSTAILSIDDTPNGRLQSLYLFFPAQGIVTATYLFDDEITEPNEDFPVMMAYQSKPQADSVGLLNAAFAPWDTSTYEEWVADLQPWEEFDRLVVTQK